MYNIEKKTLNWIEQHLNILYLIVMTLLAFSIRLVGFSFLSGDMSRFLIPWFDKIRESGLSSRVGDYNLLYQTLIYAMTFIPLPIVWQYKLLSVFFDFALAVVCGKFCCELRGKRKNDSCFLFVYTAVLFFPTVFLNSGFWGQCDSIYVYFVILSMYLLYVERTTISFVMLGIAFAFKLQSIFIVPFYLYYYFSKKSFSLFSFLIVPGVLLLSGFFCYVQGQSILTPIQIYFHQTKEYSESLYMNIHSFFTVFQQNDQILVQCLVLLGVFLTVSIFGGGLYVVIRKRMDLSKPKTFITIAAWCAWVCILFLPKMHERYTYLLDILLLLLITLDRKYIFFAFISESLSLITYANYLGGVLGVSKFFSLLYIGAFIRFSMLFIDSKPLTSKEIFKAFRKQNVFFYILLALCAVGAISLVIFIPQVRELIIGLAEKGIGRTLTHEVWHERFILCEKTFLIVDIALLLNIIFVLVVNIRCNEIMETKNEPS